MRFEKATESEMKDYSLNAIKEYKYANGIRIEVYENPNTKKKLFLYDATFSQTDELNVDSFFYTFDRSVFDHAKTLSNRFSYIDSFFR